MIMKYLLQALAALAVISGTSCNIISSDTNCVNDCIAKEGKNPVCDEGGYQFENDCVATKCSKVII